MICRLPEGLEVFFLDKKSRFGVLLIIDSFCSTQRLKILWSLRSGFHRNLHIEDYVGLFLNTLFEWDSRHFSFYKNFSEMPKQLAFVASDSHLTNPGVTSHYIRFLFFIFKEDVVNVRSWYGI